MFKNIKKKIKLAKLWAIIFWIVFLLLILNSICLTYKVHKLEKMNYNNTNYEHKVDCKYRK